MHEFVGARTLVRSLVQVGALKQRWLGQGFNLEVGNIIKPFST